MGEGAKKRAETRGIIVANRAKRKGVPSKQLEIYFPKTVKTKKRSKMEPNR